MHVDSNTKYIFENFSGDRWWGVDSIMSEPEQIRGSWVNHIDQAILFFDPVTNASSPLYPSEADLALGRWIERPSHIVWKR